MARKKKGKENKRAEPGSGEQHDKHAETEPSECERAEPGSGVQHDKHAPTDSDGIPVDHVDDSQPEETGTGEDENAND